MSTFTKEFNYNLSDALKTKIENENWYVFLSHPFSWDDDFNPPSTNKSDFVTFFDLKNNMLFGKKVNNSDIHFLIEKKLWEPNKIYTEYTNDNPNLFESDFYVMNRNFCVYKCIYSPNTPSTEEPIATTNEIFTMGDEYSWKFMYQVPQNIYRKYTTTNFIPVFIDSSVRANAANGSIENVTITNSGQNYSTFNEGNITGIVGSNFKKFRIEDSEIENDTANNFYKDSSIFIFSNNNVYSSKIVASNANSSGKFVETEDSLNNVALENSTYIISPTIEIQGDGTNFNAYLIVNKNTKKISDVKIVNSGQNYTYADLKIIENQNYGSGGTLKAQISPPGGHGYNAIKELNCNKIGISIDFKGNENFRISDNIQFRSAGLLVNPKLKTDTTMDYVDITFNQIFECEYTLNSVDMKLRKGDYIQTDNSLGRIISGKDGILKALIFFGTFNENDSFIVRNSQNQTSGKIGSIIRSPNIDKYEGNIYFVQHFQPIQRIDNSTEEFKLVIEI